MAEVWLSRLTLPWPWRKFLVRSKQTSLQQESASLLCQLSTCQLSLIIKSNFHPNSCRSLFLSEISPGNQKRLSSHCLFSWDNDHMETQIPLCFHDHLQKFLTNSSSKNSRRTEDNGQQRLRKILTPHHRKFFPKRNRDTEKLSSQVCKTHLGNTRLHYPGPNSVLALSIAGGQTTESWGAFLLAQWWF